MESYFSSLKTERTANKIYRTRDEARADVFGYIERFYNTTRRHSTVGRLSPVEFERKVGLAQPGVHQAGSSSLPGFFDVITDGGLGFQLVGALGE